MRSARFSTLACLASLSGACSDPTARQTVQTTSSAIVDGLPSTADEDFVVHIRVSGSGVCTGTLIAPNTVLTALHCVSEFDSIKTFTCNNDGTVAPISPGGGLYEGLIEPARVEIRVGPAPSLDAPSAYGARIFSPDSTTVCKDDIAVVVLDRSLEPPPQVIRLGKPIFRGSYQTIIGYGQTESASAGIRNRRTDLRVLAVGEFGSYGAQGVAVPHSFILGPGPCHGDSGGPSFDKETSAVTGVSSLLQSNNCANSSSNVFTQVGAFEDLIREALAYAGFDPLVEPGGGDGAGGEGGTGSTDPGSGGEAQGGASTDAGGAPGTGGSDVSMAGSDVSMAGGDTGEGGEGATAPATGGTGATGGATGQAGRNAGRAGSEEISEGSGSRSDASCACRLEGTASNRNLGWAGFLSLLAIATLRRRTR